MLSIADKNKLWLACASMGFVSIFTTAMTGTPDTRQTIPYPEVRNLDRVPGFDHRGIIRNFKPVKNRSHKSSGDR
jgi:hypothetical protein